MRRAPITPPDARSPEGVFIAVARGPHEPLTSEQPEERDVADEISTPEPSWLDCQSEQPLEADVAEVCGRVRLRPRDIVEGCADADHDRNVELAGHLGHPQLLFGGTECHPEDVRSRSTDLVPKFILR